MSRLIAFGVVLAAVLVSGAVAGFPSGRWGGSRALQTAAARLDQLPLSLGANWDVQAQNLREREIAIAELEGYTSRRYLHRRTGTIISVLLVCGRPGPISVHTPEVCYTGAGYFPSGAARAYSAPASAPGQFQVRDFQKGNVATPSLLRIFLSWGCKGEWSVPSHPRFAFAGKPYLYKLYVVREMARANEPLDKDPAAEFIKELMPQLQETLFQGS
jgi:hypothetical protein